jgi:hypothetical protein
VVENAEILSRSSKLVVSGVASKDVLHVACAVFAKCDVFLTTDIDLLKKAGVVDGLRVINPASFIIGGNK